MDQYFLIIALVSSLILYRSFSLGTINFFFSAEIETPAFESQFRSFTLFPSLITCQFFHSDEYIEDVHHCKDQ